MLTRLTNTIADRVKWGYLGAFIILLSSYILTFYSSQQVLNQQAWVNHTSNVINTLDDLHSKVVEAESSFRGYLLFHQDRYLQDFHNTSPQTDSITKSLQNLLADNLEQEKRLEDLKSAIVQKIDFMSFQIKLFKNNKYNISDSIKKSIYNEKILMDSVMIKTIEMQKEEDNLMNKRSKDVIRFSNLIKIINIISIIIAILLTFYSIISFTRENRAKKLADKNAEEFRKRLEQKVNELDKSNNELIELKSIEKFAVTGRLSRTIAHEVRNPLTNINLATEHLRSEMPQDSENELLFEMITRNSNRINDLISDLLNSTKAAHLIFKKESVNMLLDSSLDFAQDRLDLKKIKVIKEYVDDPVIMADKEKITIAFLNIIVNAIEAMPENTGVLYLKTEINNDRCVVTISDNGKGMDNESLSRLFEPYFTTKEKGNGLGLTNTQNIILGHQATILAESEEGKGTSFKISFNMS